MKGFTICYLMGISCYVRTKKQCKICEAYKKKQLEIEKLKTKLAKAEKDLEVIIKRNLRQKK